MTGRVRWYHGVALVAALGLAAGAFAFMTSAADTRDDAPRDRTRAAAALAVQRRATSKEADAWSTQQSETRRSVADMRAAVTTAQQLVGITDQVVDNARASQQAGAVGNLAELETLNTTGNELVGQLEPLFDMLYQHILHVNRPELPR